MELWAEIGAADGSVEYATTAARVVHQSGGHALKVQWLTPETIFHPEAERYDNTSGDWATQAGGYEKNIYPYTRWQPVIDQCEALDIEFIPAVFSSEAVEAAAVMGVKHVKVASGDITFQRLITEIGEHGFDRVTISTGASTMEEVTRAVDWLLRTGWDGELTLLACHLQYPSRVEAAHLARIIMLRQQYPVGVRIGYSDHTPGIDTVPVAVGFGAQVLEKHFTLHPGEGGGDHDFAIDPEMLSAASQLTQYLYAMIGNVEFELSPGEAAAREGARRSVYTARDLNAGEKLQDGDVIELRPVVDGAIAAEDIDQYVGKTIMRDVPQGVPLMTAMVGGVGATLTVE